MTDVGDALVRRASRVDGPAIRSLLAAAYPAGNVKADPAVMDWQYWDNPFGETRSWVAEVGGQVVSHWAAVPVPVVLGDERHVGAKGVDIATHPDYQGRGLFRRVAQHLVADCTRAGVPVVLSHPNPRSARVVAAVGGRQIARVPVHVLPLDHAWVARRFHLPRAVAIAAVRAGFPALGKAEPATEVAAPPDDLDALWASGVWGVRSGIARDAAWWLWRYQDRPEAEYRFVEARRKGRLVGVACACARDAFGGRFLLILELAAADGAVARGLAAALRDAAGDAVGMAALSLPGSRPAALALKAGFRRLPRRLEPQPLRFMVVETGVPGAAAGRWTMLWGDLDHL